MSLTQGVLTGLSRIARSGPVVMDWQVAANSSEIHVQYSCYLQDGAVKLVTGLKVAGLTAPFKGAASVRDMNLNPDINTRVQHVGVDFGFQV